MSEAMDKNISIHISDREHMNLTLNIYHCGNMDLSAPLDKLVDYYLFYYVHDGSGVITVNNISNKVTSGQGFVIFPNKKTTIKPDFGKTFNVSWIAFSGYLVEDYLQRGKIVIASPVYGDSEDRQIEKKINKILEYSRHLPNRYCKIASEMYSLFSILLDNAINSKSVDIKRSQEYYLIKALEFIDMYFGDSISIEDIATYVGITRKYLYSVFKDITELSPKDYLIYYRIGKASKMLVDIDNTVENVATYVGYSNQFYFSNEFKNIIGVTPTDYRKMVKEDPSKAYVSPIDKLRMPY